MATKLIGYRRVSTARQGTSGLGLEAQDKAIDDYVRISGGDLIASYVEVETGKLDSLKNRPQLMKALSHARRSKATLVIAKLDRLSRSVFVTAQLHISGVEFVCCDNPTANRVTIQFYAVMAEDETRRISVRTKEALAAYKAGKRVSKRVRLMYPEGVPPEVVEATAGKLGASLPQCRGKLTAGDRARGGANAGVIHALKCDEAYVDLVPMILEYRRDGLTQRAIADRLNEARYDTRRGRPWNQVQVMRILRRYDGGVSRP
jgi:DNA invertase Pin-like site-specific DNA recombinase